MPSATAEWYERAATRDLLGHSALQAEWARGIAGDPGVLALIDRLPRERRQPSLLFSVVRWLGAPTGEYAELRAWLLERWPGVEAVARTRRVQTNEAGRCAPLIAALERISGPIALVEVGASAGLCLLPDRYAYRFDEDPVVGDGRPLISCRTSGGRRSPTRIPEIAWRRGIDLQPLSVADADDVRWLEACVPPDRPDRLERLRAAVSTSLSEPPVVETGDALRHLGAVAARAPATCTLVVASLGTLVYLPPAERAAFPAAVHAVGARLVALEAVAVVPGVADRLEGLAAPDPTPFVLSLDGEPLAYVSPHGDRLSWLSPASRRVTGTGPT